MGRTWEKSELFSNFFGNTSTFKVRPCFASPGKILQIPQNEQKDQRRRSVWVGHDKFLKIGWNQQNPFDISKSCQLTVKLQFTLARESPGRKRAKNGRSSVFRFIRWSTNKNCSAVNHCLNNKIVLLISTRIVNSTILWGFNSYMSSVNSADNIREIGILLKCANFKAVVSCSVSGNFIYFI